MTYTQLVSPNLSQKTNAGWCLMFVQNSFRAPVMHASATEAANATKQRNTSRTMPNVSVPVWFDHWGTYGDYGGTYANWGHVVVWVPGRGYLSSPRSGYGQEWFPSIEAVERAFNAKFRFWSLDINTLTVAEKVTTPASGEEEDEEMKAVYYMDGKNYIVLIFDSRSGFSSEYTTTDYKYNNSITGLGTGSFVKVSKSHYNRIKADLENVRKGK